MMIALLRLEVDEMDSEKRTFELKELRTSATAKPNEKIIVGHAAVFEQKTDIDKSFYEVIDKGAFDGTIFDDVPLLVNHDFNQLPLARTGSGTLILSIDDVGLAIRAKLDVEGNQNAKALYSAVERGDVRGMSFCFTVTDDEWQNLDSDMPTRRIKKIGRVYEVSVVNWPAYDHTDIKARAKITLETAKKAVDTMTFEEFNKYMKRYVKSTLRSSTPNAAKDEEEDERTKAVNDPNAKVVSMSPRFVQGKGFIPAEESNLRSLNVAIEERNQAGENLKSDKAVTSPFNAFGERRTITVMPTSGANASIVVPQYTGNQVTADFPVVSSLVDAVAHLTLDGGESYHQPYIKGIDAGGYTQEGGNAVAAETQFDFVNISKTKITAYAELTEELQKLPAAPYADIVFQNIRTSIRQVLAQEILFGKGVEGDQPRLTGIFSPRATAIDPATDLALSAITDTTLDEIVFNYGAQNVEGVAVLIVSKLDLLAFSKVRTSTKQKFYDIQFNSGNSGRINGVPFIIDDNCKSLMAATTVAGDYCMAYGNLSNYQLVEFSPLLVQKSDDFKFRSGITVFKGSCFAGGNVIKNNGFLRCRKK